MEEKKFDPYQFIGFILIALILTWMLYRNGPAEAEPESTTTEQTVPQSNTTVAAPIQNDSIVQQQKVAAYGDLGSLFVSSELAPVNLETEQMTIVLNPKGGQISKLTLNAFENYEDQPLPLISEGNTDFNIQLNTLDGRVLNTRDMFFNPIVRDGAEAIQVEMRAALNLQQYISFLYSFPKNGHMFSFSVKTVGMSSLLNTSVAPELYWKTDVFRNSRSIDYENRYTEFTFGYEDDRVDYLSLSGDDEETRQDLRWISYRQHFFSAIMIPDQSIDEAKITSTDLSGEASLNERFTKSFTTTYALSSGGELNSNLKF